MKKNKTKELFILLININDLLNTKSKDIYKILSSFLQEKSHSFGFEPFTSLSDDIIMKIDKINNNINYEILAYETFDESKKTNDIILNQIYNSNIDKTKELLNLVMDILKKLTVLDLVIGKQFSLFLTENLDEIASTQHSFSYTNDIINYIITDLDRNIYKELNNIDEHYDDVYGIFYWFVIENIFGDKKLSIRLSKNKNIKIKNFNDFYKFINS